MANHYRFPCHHGNLSCALFIGTGSHSLRKWTFPCKPLTSDFIHRDLTKKCFWTVNCWSFFQPHVILKLWLFSIIHKCDSQKCKVSKVNHTVLLCDSHIVNRHYFHVKNQAKLATSSTFRQKVQQTGLRNQLTNFRRIPRLRYVTLSTHSG